MESSISASAAHTYSFVFRETQSNPSPRLWKTAAEVHLRTARVNLVFNYTTGARTQRSLCSVRPDTYPTTPKQSHRIRWTSA